MMRARTAAVAIHLALAGGILACSGGGGGPGPGPGGGGPVDVGDVRAVAVANGSGAVTLDFGGGGEEYVLIVQAMRLGLVPGGFVTRINGAGAALSRGGAAPAARPASPRADDAAIRRMERELVRGLPIPGPRAVRALAPAADRDFFVVNRAGTISLRNPDHFDVVPATLRYQGTRALIYVDDRDLGVVSEAVAQQIGSRFDGQIHPNDVAAFGAESDLDGNGRVLILLSRAVNALTTQEIVDDGARIVGFFFGVDLLPHPTTNPFANGGEIFYAVIPDPDKAHGAARVTAEEYVDLAIGVFAHEFEHMISFNHHVLIAGGAPEALWLDEALAHMGETINGIDLQNELRAAYFLHDPAGTTLTGGGDALSERGASWLFVHYLRDRFGAGALRDLVAGAGARIGTLNVEAVAGTSFGAIFDQWATTLLVDGGTIPNDAMFESSLDLRGDFATAKTLINQSPTQPNRITGAYLGLTAPAAADGTLTISQEGTSPAYVQVRSAGTESAQVRITAEPEAELRVTVVRVK